MSIGPRIIEGIFGNPNPDYYVTVHDFACIADWAATQGITLEDALDAGVCADDGNDNIYVPREIMPSSIRHAHDATGIRRTNTGGWAAIIDGRLAQTYEGMGAKRQAILRAGTNEVIA